MIAGGAIVAGLGWLYYATKLAKDPVAAPIVAILCAIVAAATALAGLRLFLKPPPGLFIDREGIVPNPRRPADRILWSDLKAAHLAEVRTGVYYGDPQTFQKRRDAGKRPWLGYDTGFRSDYFPIYYTGLDTDVYRLLYIVTEGIARHGRPAAGTNPRSSYGLFFP